VVEKPMKGLGEGFGEGGGEGKGINCS